MAYDVVVRCFLNFVAEIKLGWQYKRIAFLQKLYFDIRENRQKIYLKIGN